MTACLVQQLFRQKIGKELDQYLFDDVLFPLLRSRNKLSNELLLDIQLGGAIRLCSCPAIQPFTSVPDRWFRSRRGTSGRTTSRFRRKMIDRSNWGTIEILNELNDLNDLNE